MKRILILNHEFPPTGGGGANVSALLREEFGRKGYTVDVITSGFGNLADRERDDYGTIYRVAAGRRFKDRGNLLLYWKYPRVASQLALRENLVRDTHILGFFIQTGGAAGRLIKKHRGNAYTVYALGADVYDPTRFKLISKLARRTTQAIVNGADTIVFPGEDLEQKYRQHISPIIRAEIKQIPPPMRWPTQLSLPSKTQDCLTIVSVGRLVKRKDFSLIPAAAALLKNSGLKFVWKIVGNGPEYDSLQNTITKADVADRVQLTGFVADDDLRVCYQEAHILVVTSKHESFGMIVTEAMQYGCVTVTTPCGGPPEIVTGGGEAPVGLVCSATPEAICQSIRDLATAQGRKVFQDAIPARLKLYDSRTVAERYLHIFKAKSEI